MLRRRRASADTEQAPCWRVMVEGGVVPADDSCVFTRTRTRTLALALTLTLAPPPLHRLLRLTTRRLRLHLHHEQLRCRMYRQRSSSAYRCT